VKLGQILSTRPDLIPMTYINELTKLQDHVPPFPYEDVKNTIKEELGDYPENIFEKFEEEPLAAASIGQVHKATLKNGREVVVKVQRPGIKRIIEVDLEIMHYLARLMETHLKELEVQKPSGIVEEFARSLEKEINFKTESYNTNRFSKLFKNDKTITCPEVFHDMTTERVLVMELVKGIKCSDIEKLKEEGYNLKEIARRGAEAIMKQVFVHGFFHGDPHPGNLFILPENVICFIDFGMMGRVTHREQNDFASLLISIIRRDEKAAVRKALLLTQYELEPDEYLLQRDMGDLIDEHLDRPLKDLNFGRFLEEILDILTSHNLRLRPNLFMMVKALISVEKLGRSLDPELDIVSHAEPYIRKIQFRRFNPKNFIQALFDPANDFLQMLNDIPEDVSALIKKTKKGELKIEFEHQGLTPLLNTISKVSSHIAFSIVLAALIVGSSLITLSKIPPRIYDIPVIGVFGFMISGLMGFWLLWSMIKDGRMK
jgi:ubiquinone biosynthesis protein